MRRMDDVGQEQSTGGQVPRVDQEGGATGNLATLYTWPNGGRCR